MCENKETTLCVVNNLGDVANCVPTPSPPNNCESLYNAVKGEYECRAEKLGQACTGEGQSGQEYLQQMGQLVASHKKTECLANELEIRMGVTGPQ